MTRLLVITLLVPPFMLLADYDAFWGMLYFLAVGVNLATRR
jgi:hypothetical protein